MTTPITVLLFQALDNYNKVLATTPEKHTLSKALLYSIGTSIFAAMLYKSLLRGGDGGTTHSTFLSVFLKPLHFIFGSKHTVTDISSKEPTPFEDKYFKEYDEWTAEQSDSSRPPLTNAEQEHRKECLDNMYYSTVRETIDDYYGDAIMCYDHATMSFAYYARTANIPYKYLETISRKYMIETNAPREIHVDIREEFNKAKDRARPAAATTAEATAPAAEATTPAAETDVFVKLKSYNTASNLNLHTTTNEKTHKSASTTATASATPASATPASGNKIFREKSNRYSYRGKISDFAENHKTFLAERRTATATATTTTATTTTTTATTTTTEATGYAEFKKQWKNTKSAL
jgi:hypothetical protein